MLLSLIENVIAFCLEHVLSVVDDSITLSRRHALFAVYNGITFSWRYVLDCCLEWYCVSRRKFLFVNENVIACFEDMFLFVVEKYIALC